MTDKKDGAGKDAGRPPEAPGAKRPYATLDLKATEVKPAAGPQSTADAAKAAAKDASKPDLKPDPKTDSKAAPAPAAAPAGSKPDPKADAKPADAKLADAKAAESRTADPKADPKAAPKADPKPDQKADSKPSSAPGAGSDQPAASAPRRSGGVGGFFTHLAAGLVGGFLALLGADTFGPKLAPQLSQLGLPSVSGHLTETTAELQKRIADLEARKTASGDEELGRRVAALDQRVGTLDELIDRTVKAQGAEQTRLAEEIRALGEKAGPPGGEGVEARVAKLEERLRDLTSAGANDPQAGRVAQLASLTGRLSDLEASLASQMQVMRKSVAEQLDARLSPINEASEAARSGTARIDRDLSTIKTDVARINQRLETQKADNERNAEALRVVQEETGQVRSIVDGLKGDFESRIKSAAKPADVSAAVSPLASRLAALEGSVQGVVMSEDARRSNAERVVLSLELANLKRVAERGQPYATELAAVKKAAAGRIDLGLLERFQDKGVATVAELQREFRPVAERILDAATEPSAGGVVDRLLSGAKSVVRVRKTTYATDDNSPDAVVARIEAALRDGQLSRALKELKTLPPGLVSHAQAWLTRAEARQSVDNAIAAVEGQLKASLAGVPEPAEKSKN